MTSAISLITRFVSFPRLLANRRASMAGVSDCKAAGIHLGPDSRRAARADGKSAAAKSALICKPQR